jgi:peptide/nickel transport system substrate-binding protein
VIKEVVVEKVVVATPVASESDDKVTVLNGAWGSELFSTWAWGEIMGYNRQLHAYYIVGDENISFQPGVASAWEVTPDGLTWNFTIREGVKFHNGEDLTIDDALFSMEDTYGKVAKVDSPFTGVPLDTVSIKAIGNDIVVTHKKPLPFFPYTSADMSSNNRGAIVPKAYFEKVGREGYDEAPIGAGPFKFVSHAQNYQMVFERFDDYYNPARLSKFRVLEMLLVPEQSTRVAALLAGQADIIDASTQVQKQIEDGGNRMVIQKESSYMWVLSRGCDDTALPCNKKAFRQALNYAVDKDTIVGSLLGVPVAAEVRGWAYVTPSSLGYYEGLDPYPYDPKKAQELMIEAGYPGGEGVPTLKIHTWVAGDVPFMPEQAQLIAQYWKDNLGIETEINIGDENAIKDEFYSGGLAGEYLIRTNEADFDGANAINAIYGILDGAAHLGGQRLDLKAVSDEALSVVDPALRPAAMAKAYKIFHDEAYEWTTGYSNYMYGVSPRIQGWKPWSLVTYLTALWTIDIQE